MNDKTYNNFTVTTDARGVRRVVLDVPDRHMNIFNPSVMTELADIVSDLENSTDVSVVVFESGKESGFLAGADVGLIAEIQTPDQAMRLLDDGQVLFQRIEWLKMPTIVVIHGPCLGGGLEMALSCNHRIARDNPSTKIGLPEIKLGVIPGWGGTQRLPKLVGLMSALPMILQGKHLDAGQALRNGLIDRAISPDSWDEDVERFINDVLCGDARVSSKPRRKLTQRFLDGTKIGRSFVFRSTRKKIAKKIKHYPALEAAVTAIASAYQSGTDGYAVERAEFSKLLSTPTCRSLLSLFFAREKARDLKTWAPNESRAAHETPIQKIGVIGAGAMGAGIGQLASLRGFDVVLKEISEETAQMGRERIAKSLASLAKRKRWSEKKLSEMIEKVQVTCDPEMLADSDLVVEAVVERMEVKKSVFSEMDSLVGSNSILASNTSSLSINEMAADRKRPQHFGGLHFFNPVHRMELVEVVYGADTSATTVARLVAFVRALGKTPVVTKDSPGFLVNRVLFPYLGEAILMVREGFNVEKIDRDCRKFGMPMGPLELLDQVGLDVALHVATSLGDVLSETEPVVESLQEMVDAGMLGKKSGLGFYNYSKGKRGSVNERFTSASADRVDDYPDDGLTRIQRRLVYPMLAESIRCYEEKVVAEPWAIDLAMVLGTGFAPHLGGPLRVVDSIGAHRVLGNMRLLRSRRGPRFDPPKLLVSMANSGETFFGGQPADGNQSLATN